MVAIPQSVFDQYYSVCDDFINLNFGVNCQFNYLPLNTECPNCVVDLIGRKSANIYKAGGPHQFEDGMICPYCNGEGFKEEQSYESIKLRAYWTKKDWVKIAGNVAIPDGSVQVIGFLEHLPKFNKAKNFVILSDVEGFSSYKFSRVAEAFPWGFKHNRYFVGYLGRE